MHDGAIPSRSLYDGPGMPDPDPAKLDYATPRGLREWVTVKTYMNSLEAELAATALRREGIVCQIHGATVNATLGIYGPGVAKIEIQVLAEDAESARRMLDEIENKRRSRLQTSLKCPQCGGRAAQKTPRARWAMWATMILCGALIALSGNQYAYIGIALAGGMIIFWPVTPRWRCRECNHEWRAAEPEEEEE